MFSYQKTIKNKVSCCGIGLHIGEPVTLTILPAKEDTGIIFKRTDIKNKNNIIDACYKNVTATTLGTTICNEDNISVATIEHLMAAFWGCGIDNCTVELDGPEVPIMDGSSEPFVFLLECAGTVEQSKTRKVIEILKEVKVEDEISGGYLSILPSEGFSVGLEIDFNDKIISRQSADYDFKHTSFKSDLSRARTFGFEHEVNYLRSQGLARGGSLDNAIVIGKDKILNKEELRYKNEFVRHKILDCIGDVYLAKGYFKGSFHGFKSGHGLNNKLLRKLFETSDAWRILESGNDAIM